MQTAKTNAGASAKRLSTRQQLLKVQEIPHLYRHRVTIAKYGVKKSSRKQILQGAPVLREKSLGTSTHKLAEIRLRG